MPNSLNAPAPVFSVLIPSYNRPEYLAQAVQSVIDSNYPSFEILVSDDFSPKQEEVKRVMMPFLSDSRVKLYLQRKNIGMAGNWNYLVGKSRGAFILIMGDDDTLPSHSMQTIKNVIDRVPACDIYSFGYQVIDSSSKVIKRRFSPKEFVISSEGTNWPSLCFSDWLPFWAFHPFTNYVRRNVYTTLKYRVDVQIGADLVFLIESLMSGKTIAVSPEILFNWRKPNSESVGVYQTLSGNGTNNIISRIQIYRYLQSISNCPPQYANLFVSDEFLFRFVIAPYLRDLALAADPLIRKEICKKNDRLTDMLKIGFPKNKLATVSARMSQLKEYSAIFGAKSAVKLIAAYLK